VTALTSVGLLYTPGGAPCHYVVVQGFLRNGIRLEFFTREAGWKSLSSCRVVIDAEPVVSSVTTDKAVYHSRPDELLRVRFAKAGEAP